LEKSPAFSALGQKIQAPSCSLLVQKSSAAFSSLVAAFLQKKTQKNLRFVSSSLKEEELFEDLAFFHSGEILEFPALEGPLSLGPSSDSLGKRYETISQIKSLPTPKIVLTPLNALMQKLPDLEFFEKQAIALSPQAHLPFNSLESRLASLGFKRVAAVADKGEFALRGGILDIFTPSLSAPLRIEFEEDRIVQIRLFDPSSQKSIQKIEKARIFPNLEKNASSENRCSLIDFLPGDTWVAFDDLYALEENFLTYQKNSPRNQGGFFSLAELARKLKTKPKIFFSRHRLEELSEVKIQTKTPFFETVAFEAFGLKLGQRGGSIRFSP
jgi:transcription-repair coupling factor (superfamily II helicase)